MLNQDWDGRARPETRRLSEGKGGTLVSSPPAAEHPAAPRFHWPLQHCVLPELQRHPARSTSALPRWTCAPGLWVMASALTF